MIGNYDYSIVSPVENVRYTTDEDFPCEITLTNGSEPNTLYRSKNVNICEFAERRKDTSTSIKLYGKTFFGLHNIVAIEYANPNAKRN